MNDSIEIQCTIDDMSPEITGWVLEGLEKIGAQDAYAISVYRKKNRPGILLSVLCTEDKKNEIIDFIFAETTTLGLRWYWVNKERLNVAFEQIDTPWGKVRIKIGSIGTNIINMAPEYEDCRSLAMTQRIPLKQIYNVAMKLALEHHKQ